VASESREILEKFNSGAEDEALFKLLEIPGDLLPVLAAAFRTEHNPALELLAAAGSQSTSFHAEALNQMTKKFGKRRSTAW
jgi:hypothetical protein